MSRPPKVHDLKCWPEYFEQVTFGQKTADVRKDDGRDFRQGDIMILREWVPEMQGKRHTGKGRYTGQSCKVLITGVLGAAEFPSLLTPGTVVLSIRIGYNGTVWDPETAKALNEAAAIGEKYDKAKEVDRATLLAMEGTSKSLPPVDAHEMKEAEVQAKIDAFNHKGHEWHPITQLCIVCGIPRIVTPRT